jgi:hypothetical protein
VSLISIFHHQSNKFDDFKFLVFISHSRAQPPLSQNLARCQ